MIPENIGPRSIPVPHAENKNVIPFAMFVSSKYSAKYDRAIIGVPCGKKKKCLSTTLKNYFVIKSKTSMIKTNK